MMKSSILKEIAYNPPPLQSPHNPINQIIYAVSDNPPTEFFEHNPPHNSASPQSTNKMKAPYPLKSQISVRKAE